MSGTSPCTVDGCAAPAVARGWCHTHYKQVIRTGQLYRRDDPRYPGPQLPRRVTRPWAPTLEEAFWSHVERTEGCWRWKGSRSAEGLPSLSWRGRRRSAHRYSWELAHGRPLTRMEVLLPTCPDRCVNPDHYRHAYLSDRLQEAADARRAARGAGPDRGAETDR